MRQVASGKSIDVSPTFDRKIVLTFRVQVSFLLLELLFRYKLTQRIMLEVL